MACNFPFGPSLYPNTLKPDIILQKPHHYSYISRQKEDKTDETCETVETQINFLTVPITLTVICTSLSAQPILAATPARTSVRKKTHKKTQPETLSSEQIEQWSKGLPVVSNRIPYTEILRLKETNRLKHVITAPGACLKKRAEVVLVVLDDNQVLRVVLPSRESNTRFWNSWDELKIDAMCISAYTPPVKKPDLPKPYLGFLCEVPQFMLSKFKPKKKSKRAIELRVAREQLKRQRKEELAKIKEAEKFMEMAVKMQSKEEEKRRKRERRKKKFEESVHNGTEISRQMADTWNMLAKDQSVALLLGVVFMYLFYRIVVLGYLKKKKDYEERLKIAELDAQERKKMKQLDKETMEIEVEDDDGSKPGDGEQNQYQKMAVQFVKSGARVRRAHSKRLPQYLEKDVDVKFSDVAGLGKIRFELEEIVNFFTKGKIYRRRGVKIPAGILLCGSPGVGKTLLAKAVACEAGVNFLSISASEFVEIYIGVGASRVRSLYQTAKENAPSIVYIDELDAVGKIRGLVPGSGGKERDNTLNQLLVCLDGFEGKGEVVTIASTNRPDILDPALVRPGRFDRKIYIPEPSLIGRTEILKVHARKKPMADDVDYAAVASMTDGMVGAELANIIEVAAVNMMHDGRTEITTDDLIQAVQMEERGMPEKKERSSEAWKKIALNEAALAVVAVNFPVLRNIEFITIDPRAGHELGYVRMKMGLDKFSEAILSRQTILDHITVQIAPRAADELWHGESQLSTIWAETADNARSEARAYVLGGFYKKHHGLSNNWVVDRINELDLEATRILNGCYDRAKEILQQNRKLMDAVVDELVEKKSLRKEEFFHLVELYGSIKPMPPTVIDIRNAKRAELKQMMMNQKEAAIETKFMSNMGQHVSSHYLDE